jgi:hypothetical protein
MTALTYCGIPEAYHRREPGELSEVTDHPAIENDTSSARSSSIYERGLQGLRDGHTTRGPFEFVRTLAALAVASKWVVRPRSTSPGNA